MYASPILSVTKGCVDAWRRFCVEPCAELIEMQVLSLGNRG